jgi:hypothetical protein
MKEIIFSGLLFILAAGTSCSATEVEKQSAATNKAAALTSINNTENSNISDNQTAADKKNTLPEDETAGIIGTWKHISTAKTVDGKRDPLTQADISWTFNTDGTGIYKQTVKGIQGASGSMNFKWNLKGKDIVLTPSKGGKSSTYSIEKQSENEMTWRNNLLGDYYFVEKQ